jgi:small subunit ribosomal protein S8
MSMTDPIADMLTRIRNANKMKFEKVDIVKILKGEGFIKNYKFLKDRRQGIIRVYLKYTEDERRVLSGLMRISKPGRRVYRGATEFPRVRGGLGIAILSTPKGILTDKQSKKANVGGEILCYVW